MAITTTVGRVYKPMTLCRGFRLLVFSSLLIGLTFFLEKSGWA